MQWREEAREFRVLSEEIDKHAYEIRAFTARRREIIRRMREAGLSYREIGEILEVSHTRIFQIMND